MGSEISAPPGDKGCKRSTKSVRDSTTNEFEKFDFKKLKSSYSVHSNSVKKRRKDILDELPIRIQSEHDNDIFGWFTDIELNENCSKDQRETSFSTCLHRSLTLPLPLTVPPTDVLESSLSCQHLWYLTAGRRPRQPVDERIHFENLWRENFELSAVKYGSETSGKQVELKSSKNDANRERNYEIVFRGMGSRSFAACKSFAEIDIARVTLEV